MKRLLSIILCIALTGCAGASYRPLIDSAGVDMNRYEADLSTCQNYAGQVAGAADHAAIGAGIGAALGFALAAIGGRGYDRGRSAAASGLLGAASGAGAGESSQRDVIRRCMSGRGYRVLQ